MVGLVWEGCRAGLGLQQKVGGRGALHDVLLKRAGITHHLTVVHAKVSCKGIQVLAQIYGEALGVRQETKQIPKFTDQYFFVLNWTSKTCLVISKSCWIIDKLGSQSQEVEDQHLSDGCHEKDVFSVNWN